MSSLLTEPAAKRVCYSPPPSEYPTLSVPELSHNLLQWEWAATSPTEQVNRREVCRRITACYMQQLQQKGRAKRPHLDFNSCEIQALPPEVARLNPLSIDLRSKKPMSEAQALEIFLMLQGEIRISNSREAKLPPSLQSTLDSINKERKGSGNDTVKLTMPQIVSV